MATLKQNGEVATGDPIFCKSCAAAFNINSKLDEPKQMIGMIYQEESKEKQSWTCEFCLTQNEVDIEAEEFPKSNQVNYILEAAA